MVPGDIDPRIAQERSHSADHPGDVLVPEDEEGTVWRHVDAEVIDAYEARVRIA